MENPRSRSRILIIVQNLPVPLDRRVWLECNALTAAGYGVSVICPKGPGDPAFAEIDGVRLYKYAPPPPAEGVRGYLVEFGYCWVRTAALSLKVLRRDGFDIIQACNPPDTYWALALLYRALGKKFVYDQHDLNPEVFRSRFGEPTSMMARLQYRALLWLERRTYRTADRVVSTNESYRQVALRRGNVAAEHATIVRSGPDTTVMRPVRARPELRLGRKHLLAYLGIMGPQDGVDIVLRTLDVLVNERGREDVSAALLGFGDTFDELVALAAELGLSEYVTFTGRVGPQEITDYLSTASVGLSPDPFSPLNDVSTMNKTMEYMSFALPVVAFDLTETRISGGGAVRYVEPARSSDPDEVQAALQRYADAVEAVLDDPEQRATMGLAGRRRAEADLDWRPQSAAYVGVFDSLTGRPAAAGTPPPPAADSPANEPSANQWGAELVPVADDEELRRFARDRS